MKRKILQAKLRSIDVNNNKRDPTKTIMYMNSFVLCLVDMIDFRNRLCSIFTEQTSSAE